MEDKTTFTLSGEEFEIMRFPSVYKIYKHDPTWAETQVNSLADIWHEGDIVAAINALESDLSHQN